MAVFVLKYVFGILSIIVVVGCTKTISIDLPRQPNQIAIDGWIEPDRQARILLTLTTDFDQPIDSASYRDVVLTRAKLSLLHNDEIEVLALVEDDSYFPPHMYKTRRILGEIGGEYTLIVEYDGQIASATTQILEPIALDSVWYALETGQDSLGSVWIEWVDPLSEKNYYRFQTKVRGEDKHYIGNLVSTLEDRTFGGRRMKLPLYRGYGSISDRLREHRFKLGDTVDIRFSSIGETEFKFWNGYDNAILNAGNPFASGGDNLVSNVEGGIGNWTGYGSYYATIVCK